MTPIKLEQADIDVALESLPAHFSQAHRMLQYLSTNPNAVTVDVNRECAIGNLSDVARKANPYLIKHGLFISCQRPPVHIKNRFNEASNMFLWGVFQIPGEAANDDLHGANTNGGQSGK